MLRWSSSPERADWLLATGLDLVLGPAGYDAYARLPLLPDPAAPGQAEANAPDWPDQYPRRLDLLVDAVDALTQHTASPEDACFLVWNSGVSDVWRAKRAGARVAIPHRTPSFLAEGSLADLPEWHRALDLDDYDAPSFIWPQDRAWCLTFDVDPHFATAAGSPAAVETLLAVPRLHAVRAAPGEPPPFYCQPGRRIGQAPGPDAW